MTTLPLPALAERIVERHEAAHAAARSAIEHAIECGRLLIEAKRQIGHGGWLSWVEANLPFGERQCRNYMRIARNQAEVLEAANRQRDSDLPMRAAAALLASPRTGHGTIFDELVDLNRREEAVSSLVRIFAEKHRLKGISHVFWWIDVL